MHIKRETDSVDKIFFLRVQLCSLQLLGSELTETTAQMVMEFYILVSVIVMIHKTGGEKYTYHCCYSYIVLDLNIPAPISACAVTPLTTSQLVKFTFQTLLNIK